MLDMAAHGCKGINFHGGPGAQIAGSLGDKLPGAQSAADLEVARLGTFYSPFAGNRAEGFSARPIFYGMMLVEQFARTTLVANSFDALGANATAYCAKAGTICESRCSTRTPDATSMCGSTLPGPKRAGQRLGG